MIIKIAARESDESDGTDPSWSSYSNAMGSQAIKPKRDVGGGETRYSKSFRDKIL